MRWLLLPRTRIPQLYLEDLEGCFEVLLIIGLESGSLGLKLGLETRELRVGQGWYHERWEMFTLSDMCSNDI